MKFAPYVLSQSLDEKESSKVSALGVSFCGRYVACGTNAELLLVWELSTGNLLQKIGLEESITSLVWHKNEPTLLFGCQRGLGYLIRNFQASIENKAYPILTGVMGTIYAIDHDAASDHIAVVVGCEIHIARRMEGDIYATFVIMPSPPSFLAEEDKRIRPTAVHLIQNGSKVIASYLNHGIICWDVMGKYQVWRMLERHHIGSSAISPDGRKILVYDLLEGLDLYRIADHTRVQMFGGQPDEFANRSVFAAFLNVGTSVVCGSLDGKVRIWDTATAMPQQVVEHEGLPVQMLVTLPRGILVTAPASESVSIKVWTAFPLKESPWLVQSRHISAIFRRLTLKTMICFDVVLDLVLSHHFMLWLSLVLVFVIIFNLSTFFAKANTTFDYVYTMIHPVLLAAHSRAIFIGGNTITKLRACLKNIWAQQQPRVEDILRSWLADLERLSVSSVQDRDAVVS